MEQKRKRTEVWKSKRHGFKNELIRTLVDHGFTWREATGIIDAIFTSVADALKRWETVCIAGFGTWTVIKPNYKRTWRLKRVVKLKNRVVFDLEDGALRGPFGFKWKPHTAWAAQRHRPPDRRSKKYKLYIAQKERERHDRFLSLYMSIIGRFFGRITTTINADTFWMVRHSPYFTAEAAPYRPQSKDLRPIEDAADIIAATAIKIPWNKPNRVMDYVGWYARWSCQLKVDQEIWKEAEDRISAIQRGVYYHQ